MLVGLPRSGKSTWVESHKDLGVIVSTDWIREEILGTHYTNNANSIVWTITDSTLRIVLGQGKNAILDAVNGTKVVREYYIKLARQYNANVHFVYVNTPLDVCLERNKDNPKLSRDKIIDMHTTFEAPEIYEFDTLELVSE